MPRLPVPPLDQSVNLYLKSIIPFLLQSSEKSLEKNQFEKEYQIRKEWANELCMKGGLGERLQERLIDIDRSSTYNWLDDNYWIKIAYHSNRVPLPINSNWWILIQPDSDIPNQVIESIPENGRFTDWQLRRASVLINRTMIFKQKLDNQEIIPESSRAGRFCMHQYDCLYGITRIPNKPSDQLNIPSSNSRHIVVMIRDHIYTLDVLDREFCPLSSKQIESRLWSIVNHVTLQPPTPSIGCLTGLDRDSWTEIREHLLSLPGSTNRTSMNLIEDALFVLCLEDFTQPGGTKGHIKVASTNGNGCNRWFDKSFAFIVENNSRASVLGEHSPCDALIPAILTDFVLAEGVGSGWCDPKVKEDSHRIEFNDWKKLEWVTDSKVLETIENAKETVQSISDDSDADVLRFEGYGLDFIRQSARLSPDAYIQMAMQLAWYRQIGTVVSTYETGLTRLFKHGRTDVIRTLSKESYEFVKAMSHAKTRPLEVYNFLVEAVANHNKYTKEVSLGRGFDRHFLGLRLQHRPEEDGPLPLLFTDPVFHQSAEWQLSTSGLSAGDRFTGTGFGCYGRGYGINYLVGTKMVKFGIETKKSDVRTSSKSFGEELCKALWDMKEVCESIEVKEFNGSIDQSLRSKL
ncbi:uncharacterized protein MELLADRAFT_44686 [Melampsora larici-populina 98AG31]|uniref:Choline/carnitine acyltransferase domain-containing protein n=1 Tax=Melampsora larici-populina (strain 98AG31 / pathotype 3-4-7) TaxID=747676 RepID=F4RWY7_MELLP|nr:uncharacterized protein MELLADRAFT_44686 [Melampsora larici-populina 98AG31]EGG03140.1 hypothetical protein MELLADRAFT_44686 [Melampsora larici-populina 98AG31]